MTIYSQKKNVSVILKLFDKVKLVLEKYIKSSQVFNINMTGEYVSKLSLCANNLENKKGSNQCKIYLLIMINF